MSFFPRKNSHAWSVADQVVVSGCNFLIGILLARLLGLEAFGTYAVAQMYLLYANTFQQSLVSSTMMTSIPAEPDADIRADLIRGFFGYSLLALIAITLAVQGGAWLLGLWSSSLSLNGFALPLAAAMAGYQVQDWLRRALYVQSDNKSVFISDVLAYGGQLIVFSLLGWQRNLNVSIALWAVVGSYCVSAMYVMASQRLFPDFAAALKVIRAYGRNSRHLFISSQLQWVASSGVVLVGAGFIGQQAAGAIRAAQNLLGPVNVVFQWMDNVILVRTAMHIRDHGHAALVAYLVRIGWIGIVVIGLVALALSIIDNWLIVVIYGEAYRPFAILLVLQAIYYLFGHAYRMMSYFNRAIGNTIALAKAGGWWAVVAVAVALGLVHALADRGIMLALIFGEVAALVYLFGVSFASSKAKQP